ncbi:hypothetical protein HMN09_01097500 [Mycena chlorophos]|uniref:F-box domain-containing protein n=1 Tax=Mycena chlorophos TaxID=658473 RepID=A0A8H6VWC2_MYCCL|nr:hypothetical protein HMN09_01097500 [Mycena chlorophos]
MRGRFVSDARSLLPTSMTERQARLLLDLPTEIILCCLHNLTLDDLSSCLFVFNRQLCRIITHSVLVRYRVEQELAGVQENVRTLAGLSISERRAALQARNERWDSFSPISRLMVPFTVSSAFLYDLAAGHWLMAVNEDGAADGVMPSKLICANLTAAEPQFQTVFTGAPFVNFTTGLEEDDLLVLVTCVPCADDPTQSDIDAHILALSTGAAHPRAARPMIHLHRRPSLPRPSFEVGIEICGPALALNCQNLWMSDDTGSKLLHIVDWRTGEPYVEPFDVHSCAIVFLASDILAIPHPRGEGITVMKLPSSPTPSSHKPPTAKLVLLEFPALKPNYFVMPIDIQFRHSPLPRHHLGDARYVQAAFLPALEDTITLLSFSTYTTFEEQPGDLHANVLTQTHLAVIRTAALVQTVLDELEELSDDEGADTERNPEREILPTIFPWAAWGPPCVLWLDPELFSRHHSWISTACGSRLAGYPPFDPEQRDARHPVRILDFNPHYIAHLRRRFADNPADPQWENVRIVETATVQGVDSHFLEPVVSELAYVETTSKETYDFHDVFLSEQALVGIRYGPDGDTLDVMRFG